MVKRRKISGAVVLIALIGLLIAPTLAAAQSSTPAGAIITVDARWIKQGGLTRVFVAGQDIASVTAMFQNRVFYFYPGQRGFTTLLSASIDEDAGTYTMQVVVKYADGSSERLDQAVEVNSGGYASVDLPVPSALVPLIAPEVEESEMDKLFNIMDRFTPERYYEGGFELPNTSELVAWFGTYRRYNSSSWWTRHTGIDMRVGVGTSVAATASGRVMLSQPMPIRGNYILIDHGWGIYSGYAHLSERFVVPGDWVHKGDIIGLSGMTGRTTGAHLHFEMAVGGAWIDPEDLLAMGLDAAGD